MLSPCVPEEKQDACKSTIEIDHIGLTSNQDKFSIITGSIVSAGSKPKIRA